MTEDEELPSFGAFAAEGVDPTMESSAALEKAKILETAEEAQIEACEEFVEDMRKMVNNPGCSDVEFLCSDGERVQASRMLLAGRCSVLRSMLMNGMAESRLAEIALPGISSRVLISICEYLYTGSMLDHPPQSWRMAFEIITASRFFLLRNLEKIVWKFLVAGTSDVAAELGNAALMLTEAMEFKTLFDKEEDVILLELVDILSAESLPPVYLGNLSLEAFRYLLQKTASDSTENEDRLSFKEYLRFRQVILWCACSSLSDWEEAEDMVNCFVPDEKTVMTLWTDPFNTEIVDNLSAESARHSENLNAILDSADSAATLLSMIDWRCIHPLLLVKIVKPLGVISSEELMKAFEFHALRRPMFAKMPECCWEHGKSYSSCEDGFVIQRVGKAIGFATATVPMSRSYGIYEWCFIVEQQTQNFCELGFIFSVNRMRLAKLGFDGEVLSDQISARALNDTMEGASINWQGDEPGRYDWKTFGKKVGLFSTVLFHFNVSHHTCSITIDGKDFGVAWRNLPDAVYYPAVSLGDSSSGRVRIKLVSGFDIL